MFIDYSAHSSANPLHHAILSVSFLLILAGAGLGTLNGQPQSFPDSWEGTWSGTLEIYYQNQVRQKIPMELSIRSIDSNRWEYLTLYKTMEQPVRKAYVLVARKPELGQYLIDEKNGITLEAQFQEGCLYSAFEVMGSYLQSRSCKHDSTLHYEIISGPRTASQVTGDTIIGRDTIPPIRVFSRPSVQRAILRRKP